MRNQLTHKRLLEVLDYDPASGLFCWKIRLNSRRAAGDIAGTPGTKGYIQIKIDGAIYLAHRLAWFFIKGEWPPVLVDHDNGITSDNRWSNLRLATHSQNNANRRVRRDNKLGVKGVVELASGRYGAFISISGRRKNLGTFDTIIEAATAYEISASSNFKEFARVA